MTNMYEETPRTAQEYRAASVAGIWSYDVDMERLAELQETRPSDFDRLGAQHRMQLGFYLESKAAAAAAGVDTTRAAA